MRKEKKYYIICWALIVMLFNLISFITPSEIGGVSKYNNTFWSVYGIVMGAFVIHLVYNCVILKGTDKDSIRKSRPLFIVSGFEMLILAAVGLALMLIPGIKCWVGIIVRAVLVVLSIIFLLSIHLVEGHKYR